jgi:MFS family permease
MHVKWAACLSILFQALSMGIALTATENTPIPVFCLSAVLLGLGIGGNFPTLSILTSTIFGLRSYGSIFGMFNFALFISCSLGPIIAGHLWDISGAYTPVFKVFLPFYAFAVLAIIIIPRAKNVETAEPETRYW